MTKTCSKCREERPVAEFSKHPHTKDRLQSWCRWCTTKARHKRPLFTRPVSLGGAAERKEFVREYLIQNGCMDCGYDKDARALSFDHRPGTVKVRDIKSGQQLGWKALLEEIAKCDVVCMNCHVIRTSERRIGGEISGYSAKRTEP